MPLRSPHRALLLAVVVATALLGACSDDDPPSTASPTTTAPTTTLSQEEKDERALRQLADDWFEARRVILNHDGNLSDAELYLTGRYLSDVRQRVEELRGSGQTIRDDPDRRTRNQTTDVTINGDTAELVECLVDGDHLLDPAGEVINNDVSAYLVRTTAIRVPDGWRFSEQEGLQESRGSDRCAEP